jgi:hypothetical protein
MITIDDNTFSSSNEVNPVSKSVRHMTPSKVSKKLNVNTVYVVLRRVSRQVDGKKSMPNDKFVFHSNSFTPGKLQMIYIHVFTKYSS